MARRGRRYRQGSASSSLLRSSSERYMKKWDKDFSRRRDFREEDNPYLNDLKEYRADGNNLELFLGGFVGELPSYKATIIQDFCRMPPPLSPESGEAEKTEEPQAWLDDRDSTTGTARANSPWLLASGLHTQLKLPRFGLDGQPNADRRLIYVKNIRPSYIFALTDTASFHQIGPLQDAIWKHLSLKPSLKVKIPPTGFKTFTLEFNMPYLALRKFCTQSPVCLSKPMRKRTSLPFLSIPNHTNDGYGTYGLQEAHVSLSIVGVDVYNWTCYCFADTDIDSAGPNDQSQEDEQGETDEDGEEEVMKEDPIVSNDQDAESLDANMPVWDPREYFLRAVDVRMKQILREWEYVVHVVDESVEDWIRAHPYALSARRQIHSVDDVQEAFDWIVDMIGLLRYLLSHFSKTLRVWKRFVASDGDISYFTDIKESRNHQRLDSIRGVFDELTDLDETLERLNCYCQNHQKILELHLNLEGNRINRESHDLNLQASRLSEHSHRLSHETVKVSHQNNKLARLALMMSQLLAPVAIVVAYFGTQQEIFHFERNPRSFVVSVIVMTLSVNLIALFIFTAGRCSWSKIINYMLERLSPGRSAHDDVTLPLRHDV